MIKFHPSILFVLLTSLLSCSSPSADKASVRLIVLGTIQDAGSPHIACDRDCCRSLFAKNDHTRKVACLGLIDGQARKQYLLDATPDLPDQLYRLKTLSGLGALPDGILLTHAHIGHYSGLMYLGKEGKGADKVQVMAMPNMAGFLANHGPWSQLVNDSNIVISELQDGVRQQLTPDLEITPLRVPHRDEYSETVGYRIQGPRRTALFIPDIDKWERWDRDLRQLLADVDLAFVDATFYSGKELGDRDMRTIPHPSIQETMAYLADLPVEVRNKVHFIHLNHTNPALDTHSEEYRTIRSLGFNVAQKGDIHPL